MCFWLPEPARCCVGSCLQCSHCGALAALHRIRLCLPKFTFISGRVLSSDKTKRIFVEYVGLDVTLGWTWANYDPEKARSALNSWIAKRGDAVHRSRPVGNGVPAPHLVKREELEKAIRFIKDLVKATDAYVEKHT